MLYHIKLYDEILVSFSINTTDILAPVVTVQYVNTDKPHLFPPDLEPTENGVWTWLRRRTIPKNRAFVEEILKALGLDYNNVIGIMDVCRGLSLTDSYWVVRSDFEGKFADYNLFENPFSKVLSLVAYTGIGGAATPFTTSPELTTDGMLPKSWRTVNGVTQLYKSGTSGAANTGREPYSEFYAYQVAEVMGLNATPYDLHKWKGRLCSTCELFTDIDTSYVPASKLIQNNTPTVLGELVTRYKELGEDYYQHMASMFVFDAVIFNTDRHTGNFGLLRDNHTGEYISCAPLFDHGLSLFNYAMDDDLTDLPAYAKTRTTPYQATHDQLAKQFMGAIQREQLRHLFDFEFTKHKRYNLPAKRLKTIERFIQKRARERLHE